MQYITIKFIPSIQGKHPIDSLDKAFQTIKTQLKWGDIQLASALSGCSENTLRRMLMDSGHPSWRNPNTTTGARVLLALDTVAEQRLKLQESFNKRAQSIQA